MDALLLYRPLKSMERLNGFVNVTVAEKQLRPHQNYVQATQNLADVFNGDRLHWPLEKIIPEKNSAGLRFRNELMETVPNINAVAIAETL